MNRLLTIVDSKYQRLEYLESTGTQYIDTGYKPKNNTYIETYCKFTGSYTQSSNNTNICGSFSSSSWFRLNFGDAVVSSKRLFFWVRPYAGQSWNIERNDYSQLQKIAITDTKAIWGDLSVDLPTRESESNLNMIIFGANNNGTIYPFTAYNMQVHKCFKIWEGTTLVRNFVPVLRKTDNELGMLDLVEGKFYPNAGTGKFTANLDTMYAIIQGSPTQSPYGVFSGFSTSNYLKVQGLYDFSQPFEIKTKIHLNSNPSASSFISIKGDVGYIVILVGDTRAIGVYMEANDGTSLSNGNVTPNYIIPTNTDVFFKFVFTGTEYALYISTDDSNYTKYLVATSSKVIGNNKSIILGANLPSQSFSVGSIDLNNSCIKINSTKYKLQAVVGYTIVGSPTITDGIVSGFSGGNYLQLPSFNPSNNFEMVFKFKFATSSIRNPIIGVNSGGIIRLLTFTNDKLLCSLGTSSTNFSIMEIYGTDVLQTDTYYWIKFKFTGEEYIVEYSIDGINYIQQIYKKTSTLINSGNSFVITIGRSGTQGYALSGSIDLNETYIKQNNKLWFNGKSAQ